MKKWEVVSKFKVQSSKFKVDEIVEILLENRGIKTKKEKENFLNPKLSDITSKSLKIDKKQLNKSVERIKKAIKNKEQIVIFGDYDVDGICGSAILWETLNSMGAKVMPYIPHRIDEGYGLSIKGVENLKFKIKNCSLIITVDNGIVANKAVDFAKTQGIDVIITDHHVPSKKLPKAFSIVHTTMLCGTGVAYLLSQAISNFQFLPTNSIRAGSRMAATIGTISNKIQNTKPARNATQSVAGGYKIPNDHLGLVALATVSDLVPLVGANRTLLKYGLLELHKTKRLGLLALFDQAQINQKTIGVYEIGHIIAPRLNATGRLGSAMDSLRLICTNNKQRARVLAHELATINKERQDVTEEALISAKAKVIASKSGKDVLLFVSDPSYEQGVVGLVAGKLVEEFYKPSIVVSKGEIYSRASARSISGFNIIEFLRNELTLLVDVGGHPMAAGFTVETKKLSLLEKNLQKRANKLLNEELLKRSIKIDLEIPFLNINQNLYDSIQKLAPFGMKNPEPVFLTRNFIIENIRLVGNDGKHLKIKFSIFNSQFSIEGIYFGGGENHKLKIKDRVNVVYTLSENEWKGNKNLQLKIRDIRK